jgi:hypothetical protein
LQHSLWFNNTVSVAGLEEYRKRETELSDAELEDLLKRIPRNLSDKERDAFIDRIHDPFSKPFTPDQVDRLNNIEPYKLHYTPLVMPGVSIEKKENPKLFKDFSSLIIDTYKESI